MVSPCLSFNLHHPTSSSSSTFRPLTLTLPKALRPSPSSSFPRSNELKPYTKPTTIPLPKRRTALAPMTVLSRPPGLEFDADPTLTNEDLRPTTPRERTFSGWEMASLWVGLVVGVPSYYLAGSLVDLGMAWWQGIATVVVANLILLGPLILTGHPGTRYGIPFPVLARSSFGIRGAHVPTLLRALVGCGWYGIESWIGGEAIFVLLPKSIKQSSSMLTQPVPWLGTSPLEFACFLAFWTAQLAIVWKGMEGIRKLEKYAKAQKDQILGHIGLPIFMGLFTFVGLAATSSTKVIFGEVISSPIQLLERIGGPVTMILAILGISLATVTTNIAANVVAPANALVNLSPSTFTFRRGALLTALLGIAFQPWRLLKSSESFVYTWLVGYSALLGPIGGIILADYYLIRGTRLSVRDLYSLSPSGEYHYTRGYNLAALVALGIGILPVIPGFLHKVGALGNIPNSFVTIYNNAWFFSFFLAGFVYWVMSNLAGKSRKVLPYSDPLLGPEN
ncbi:hypothetical protein CRG98_031070 [Punica granatum]|uniref:Purine-uracil permease NCS1 n=1 Tax=Punica granatum TaxID=22663 RepID=A0A2I0IWZ5_PUNGR|nr:hypothetical protein CRG98_031070 [Punica granatum]